MIDSISARTYLPNVAIMASSVDFSSTSLLLSLLLPSLAQTAWVSLFDGTDLRHFDRLGEAQWELIEDYVEADGYESSYLVSKEDYADFELEVDFWPSGDANSGVYLRCQDRNDISAEDGYEINIYDSNPNPDNRTGAIIHFSPPMQSAVAGERWNTFKIRANGSRIIVYFNGVLVNDLDDASYTSGPIALQSNGGLIRFRNVRVKRL